MSRKVRPRASFRTDALAQLAYLRRRGEQEWIDGLRVGLREARALLGRHPAAGTTFHEAGGATLRRLVLRRIPFVIWYTDDGSTVWLLRLFHARQYRRRR